MTCMNRSAGLRLLGMTALSLVLGLTACSGGGLDNGNNGGVAPLQITLNSATPCTGSNGRQVVKIDFSLSGVSAQQFQLLLQYFFDTNMNGQLDAGESPVMMTPASMMQLSDAGIASDDYFDPATTTSFGANQSSLNGVFYWCVNSDLPFGGNVCALIDGQTVVAGQSVQSALMCNVDAPAGLPMTSSSGDTNAAPGPQMGSGALGVMRHTAVNLFHVAGNQIVIAGGLTEDTGKGGLFALDSIEDLAFDTSNMIHTTASGPFTMATERVQHASSFFYDSSSPLNCVARVLVAGGMNDGGTPTNSTEIYANGAVTTGPAMNATRFGHTATWLPNNTVLIAGGDGTAASTAEIYDPVTNTFTTVAFPMPTARTQHTACLLPDGRVLLAGGFDPMVGMPLQAVTFDLKLFQNGSNPWATDSGPAIDRRDHTATVLVNGVCYLIGGRQITSPTTLLGTAHAYRTFPMTFGGATIPAGFSSQVDFMLVGRANHATTRLGTGELLVTGGLTALGMGSQTLGLVSDTATNLSEAFLPACFTEETLGAFSPVASLSTARAFHTSTTVNGGAAVIIGGSGLDQSGPALDSVEYYPFTNSAPVATNLVIDFATASSNGGIDVPVTFNLDDAEGDKAFCILQVSDDNGATFRFATLTNYADTVNLQNGTVTLHWNAAADGIAATSALLRLTPIGGTIGDCITTQMQQQ